MGQSYLIEGAQFIDTKYPKIYDDIRLTDGSLMLIDFTHSMTGISGNPSNGEVIPNIAVNTAKKLVGGGTKETLGCFLENTFDATSGKLERTSKGALHGIVSLINRNWKVAGLQYNSTSAPLLFNFIKNHLNDEYAVFVWTNVTRTMSSASNVNDSLALTDITGAAARNLLGLSIPNDLGLKRVAQSQLGFSGSLNVDEALNQGFPFYWGQTPPYTGFNPNSGKSMVLYGYHLIHVPSSGMTFAELDARDAELYSKFFGEGGRYYGDTYSNPSSVLA